MSVCTSAPAPPRSSLEPRRVVPSTDLPLPRRDYPLLHSLLDSPEYRATVEKHPELLRPPQTARPVAAFHPPNSSLVRASSSKSATRTPSRVDHVWKKAKGGHLAVSTRRAPSASTSNDVSHRRRRGEERVVSSSTACIDQGGTIQSAPPRQISTQRLVEHQVAPPPLPASTDADVTCRVLGRDQLGPTIPNPSGPRRSLPACSSYPARRPLQPPSSPRLFPPEPTPPRSFSRTIAHLRELLSGRPLTQKPPHRPQSHSAPSLSPSTTSTLDPKSASHPDTTTRGVERSRGSTENPHPRARTPTEHDPRPSLTGSERTCSTTDSDFVEIRPSRSAAPTGENRLRARPPVLAPPDLPNYLESRRQLFQLLREGPGGEYAATSSPVLQATIRGARNAYPGSARWRGKRQNVLDTDRREDGPGSEATRTALRRKSSTFTFRSRKEPKRPRSHNGIVSAAGSDDSSGFIELAQSASLDGCERGAGAYSAYGGRWEKAGRRRRKEDDDVGIWSKWSDWVKERGDHVGSRQDMQ